MNTTQTIPTFTDRVEEILERPESYARFRLRNLGYERGQNPEATRLPSATRLWLEWDEIGGRRRTVHRASNWPLPGGPVRHLDEVLARAGYGQDPKSEPCDEYLSQLAAIAKTDDLACRIVIQRILPGLIATALRRGRIVDGGAPTALDELLSAAWVVIRNYPIDRRPRRVAANLLRDIEYLAFVRDTRSKRHRTEFASDNSTLLSLGTGLHSKNGTRVFGVLVAPDSNDPTADQAEFACILDELKKRGLRPIDLEAIEGMLTDRLSPDSARVAEIGRAHV